MDFVKDVVKAGKRVVKVGVGLAKSFDDLHNEPESSVDEAFRKGHEFEIYTLRLFNKNEFDLLYATPTRGDYEGRIIESAKDPDFKFRHKKSIHEFWVECKYRSDYFREKLEWCKDYQLQRYKDFQERERPRKVYVVMGLGGLSSEPESMYRIPLDEIKYTGLYPSVLKKYERNPTKPFDYRNGRLI